MRRRDKPKFRFPPFLTKGFSSIFTLVEWESQNPNMSQARNRSSHALAATMCIRHRNTAGTLHESGFRLIIQTLEQEPWHTGYWRGWPCSIAILDVCYGVAQKSVS